MGALSACSPTAPGPIRFGPVENPETTFSLDEEKQIAWTATLPEPVGDTSVNLVISPQGGRSELFGYRQFTPGATTLVNEMTLGRFIRDPGVYVMRYISIDGEVLAEGEFELVDDTN